ncbi:MAG: hypothetical protein E7638_00395 [Ruminococcaceae bacterium]|nr:hypothetical protein [Oscillospiraceae bacterium]
MKYCTHCGAQIHEEAVVCVHCGCSVEDPRNRRMNQRDDTLGTVVKVFMILGCISQGWMILPLLWCIPMTISVFNSLNENRPIGVGMKICTLLFVNTIAGVCMLCMDD